MRRLIAACLASLILAGTVAAQTASTDPYEIRLGDRISISVLEDPSLNQTVLVRPDGRVSLPLAGTVIASGRTPEELQTQIQRLLAPSS